jgi:capsular polysaccharide biosynthesis protein
MAISERESEITFASYMVHLWRSRYKIIAGTLVAMFAAAVYVQFIAKEVYEATAQVLVKQKPRYTDSEREEIDPPAYEVILMNDDLIDQVKKRFEEMRDVTDIKLEQFRRAFSVETETVQDTSVRREYSPVIQLAVQGDTPEDAKYLMDLWTSLFIQNYGDIIPNEALYTSQLCAKRIQTIQEELKTLEEQHSQTRWLLQYKIKELTDKENMLAPAPVEYDFQKPVHYYYKWRTSQQVEIQMREPQLPQQPGLKTRLTEAEVDVAKGEAVKKLMDGLLDEEKQIVKLEGRPDEAVILRLLSTKLTDAEIQKLLEQKTYSEELNPLYVSLKEIAATNLKELEASRAEREVLMKRITTTENEITQLQQEVARLDQEYSRLDREVQTLRDNYRLISDVKNQADLEAGIYGPTSSDESEAGDVRILASAALPDLRIFPKKSVTCLIVGALGFLLSCLLVVLYRYLEDAERLARQRG